MRVGKPCAYVRDIHGRAPGASGFSKKPTSSSGLMYLEKVCVPGSTSLRSFSAATIVSRYDSGVRAIVDRNRCPPGYDNTKCQFRIYEAYTGEAP